MNGFRALLYLDTRRLFNTIRNIYAKPGRFWSWILFIIVLVGPQILRRFLGLGNAPSLAIVEPFSTMIGGVMCIVLGWSVVSSAKSGRLEGSNDPVDAYLLVRSQIPEPLAFLWLRVRFVLLTLARSIFLLVMMAVLFTGKNLVSSYAAVVGVILLWNLIEIPAFFAARRSQTAVVVVGFTVEAFGGVLVLASALPLLSIHSGFFQAVLQLNVGTLVQQLSLGSALPLACAYAASFGCIAIGAFCSRDIYPELYASSRKVANTRQQGLERRLSFPVSRRSSRSGTRSPLRGPYAEIWKQFAFARRANGNAIVAGSLAGAAVLGSAIGVAMRMDYVFGYMFLGMASFFCAMWLAVRGVNLATDLSKPLWWLGDGSLFEKLFGWSVGTSLAASALLAVMVVAVSLLAQSVTIAVIGLVSALCVPFAFRSIGVFVYSVTPSLLDQRGPGMLLRVLLIYAALVPAGSVAFFAIMMSAPAETSFFLDLCVFVLEGVLALYVAARRIEGRGVEFARAEQQ